MRKAVYTMKKTGRILLLSSLLLSLSSYKVNWFSETVDVPWYYVAIPVTLIFVIGYGCHQ